jgi:peptidoglycan hydrolase-like protein with peptidoglycan-binding domain
VRPKAWTFAASAVLIAVTVAGGVLVSTASKQPALAAQPPAPNTATVQKRTLTAIDSQAGILTYRAQGDGSPYPVFNQATGTYTKLPMAGQVIAQGRVLYRVNNSPVVLLYGSTPAYRTLSVGATGPDVAELNADLVSLGYATKAQLNPRSACFGWATTAAVEKLQAAVGLTQSGTLTVGQAVFEPTAVRVTALSAQLGGRAQPGQAVMQGTSTARQVQLALDASQQTDVAVGDKVTITLPNNRTTPGVVSSVGTVATCPQSSGPGGSSSSSAAPGTDSCSSGSSASATPTITVNVNPSDPAATGKWDQAPVQVGITTASVPDALVVPVTALLAESNGGYAVEVVGPSATSPSATNHLVPVSLGLFDDADGLVQVTGTGLAAGQEVVVPAT